MQRPIDLNAVRFAALVRALGLLHDWAARQIEMPTLERGGPAARGDWQLAFFDVACWTRRLILSTRGGAHRPSLRRYQELLSRAGRLIVRCRAHGGDQTYAPARTLAYHAAADQIALLVHQAARSPSSLRRITALVALR